MASKSVAQYYAGKSVFITGATGFIGKAIVEKLLRTCPDVKTIYLLIRPKKGNSAQSRLEDFMKNEVFRRVHGECPNHFKKLRLIPGDILLEDFGISIEDRIELQRECNIFMHSAACVRFDMPLRQAVITNLLATKKALDLAEGMQQLEVFLHVSTAFSYCEVEVLDEKVYRMRERPQQLIECASWMSEELMETIKPKLLPPQPNTYGYSKALTEDLVGQYAGKFPIAVARPSIVTAALKEPICGWVDNVNGPTGIIVAAGKGVLRSMLCGPDIRADLMPVDIAVNACIVLAYLTGLNKPKDIQVCNITDSDLNPITWSRFANLGLKSFHEHPFSQCLWYPGGGPVTSVLQHKIIVLLTQLLPAYIIDFLIVLLRKKPFMVKIQKKIAYGLTVLEDYTLKEWLFINDVFATLKDKLSEQDNEIYYTDMKAIDWVEYTKNYVLGVREFICKEDLSTLPRARKLHATLYYLHIVTKVLLYAACAYFLYYLSNLIIS